ncbi:MAG: hypothetical protein AAGA65_22230 [Actinomycetota bacterium]
MFRASGGRDVSQPGKGAWPEFQLLDYENLQISISPWVAELYDIHGDRYLNWLVSKLRQHERSDPGAVDLGPMWFDTTFARECATSLFSVPEWIDREHYGSLIFFLTPLNPDVKLDDGSRTAIILWDETARNLSESFFAWKRASRKLLEPLVDLLLIPLLSLTYVLTRGPIEELRQSAFPRAESWTPGIAFAAGFVWLNYLGLRPSTLRTVEDFAQSPLEILGVGFARLYIGLAFLLNAIGLLFISWSVDDSWWESLWLNVGVALFLAAIIDFVIGINERSSGDGR